MKRIDHLKAGIDKVSQTENQRYYREGTLKSNPFERDLKNLRSRKRRDTIAKWPWFRSLRFVGFRPTGRVRVKAFLIDAPAFSVLTWLCVFLGRRRICLGRFFDVSHQQESTNDLKWTIKKHYLWTKHTRLTIPTAERPPMKVRDASVKGSVVQNPTQPRKNHSMKNSMETSLSKCPLKIK